MNGYPGGTFPGLEGCLLLLLLLLPLLPPLLPLLLGVLAVWRPCQQRVWSSGRGVVVEAHVGGSLTVPHLGAAVLSCLVPSCCVARARMSFFLPG